MAGKEVWFKNAEGNAFVCNEGSVAYDLMSKDGAFTQTDGPGGEEVEMPAVEAEAAEVEAPVEVQAPAKPAAKKASAKK